MTINECFKKIDSYLSNNMLETLVININNIDDLKQIQSHYKVDGNNFISVSKYCNDDELLQIEKMYNSLSSSNERVFLTGFSSMLRLYGDNYLKKEIKKLLGLRIQNKLVVLLYQCSKFLNSVDPKVQRRICFVENEKTEFPKIIFSTKELPIPKTELIVDGINNISDAIESFKVKVAYVLTSKSKNDFKSTIYEIEDMKKSYNIFGFKCPNTSLHESLGSEQQWAYLVRCFEKYDTIQELFISEFGGYDNLDKFINNWTSYDENKKWMFYIGLKLFNVKNNWCISYAVENSSSVNSFIKEIYRGILTEDYSSSDFWAKYAERKQMIKSIGNPLEEAIDYCGYVKSRTNRSIYYLTDNSQREKELIIEYLDKYSTDIDNNIVNVLSHVYPDLAKYLSKFDFNNKLLNDYFECYKYQKVTNSITEDFVNVVNEQAVIRSYNEILQSRSSVIESIDCDNSQAFFFDALGVEYLGYILSKCSDYNMFANVKVCRCELPSLTSFNKEFLDYFNYNLVKVNNIKDLDEIKHHGKDDFNYDKTKLPLHLIRELEIIDDNLKKIQSALLNNTYKKAIIVSDHGATRLAVIYEHSLPIDVDSKGIHGGRVCAYTDDLVKQIPQSTKIDDYLVIADYNRFKGGKMPSVEIHGGATLEEVVVPIIEIQLKPKDIDVVLIDKIVKLVRNKPTLLKLYTNVELEQISVKIDDVMYYSSTSNSQNHIIDISQIKKPGKYSMDVLSNNNLIKAGIEFTLESAMAKENDLFSSLFN